MTTLQKQTSTYSAHLVHILCVVFLSITLVFLYTPAVGASSAPTHDAHGNNSVALCQVSCQSIPQKQYEELDTEVNEKDDKKNLEFPAVEIVLTHSGIGVLKNTHCWKRSSWVPPDLALLNGAYTTSL